MGCLCVGARRPSQAPTSAWRRPKLSQALFGGGRLHQASTLSGTKCQSAIGGNTVHGQLARSPSLQRGSAARILAIHSWPLLTEAVTDERQLSEVINLDGGLHHVRHRDAQQLQDDQDASLRIAVPKRCSTMPGTSTSTASTAPARGCLRNCSRSRNLRAVVM